MLGTYTRRTVMATIITIKNIEDLRKYADKALLYYNIKDASDEEIAAAFLRELERRQKRNVKKGDSQGYDGWLYYISKNNRLAKVPNNARKRTGDILIKKGVLRYDKYGALRATEQISNGTFIKHRSLIEEISRGKDWNYRPVDRLNDYFDGTLECTMTIDRAFDIAYEPEYEDDFCLEGDLVTGQSCMSGYGDYAQQFYGGIDNCYVCRFENGIGDQVGRCIMYKQGDVRHFIRLYAKRDYARYALKLLKEEMHENDLFGRKYCIPDLWLHTNWDEDTPCLYLDGNEYGVVEDGNEFYVTTGSVLSDLKHTGCDSLKENLEEDDCWQCEHCGSWHNSGDCIEIDDYCYCCSECAEADGYRQCDECGEWKNELDMFTVDGYYYCSTNCAAEAGYKFCEYCRELIEDENPLQIGDHFYCSEEHAQEAGWGKCEYCGDWMRRYLLKPNFADDNKLICASCANENDLIEGYGKQKKD